MTNLDIIKEYLVKLGFEIDNPAYAKLKQVLSELTSVVNKSSSSWLKSYTNASVGMIAAIGAIVTATTKMTVEVAKADLGYQKLALRMHMTKEQAKNLSLAQKALGESIQDIYWIPELREQYKQLRGEAIAMSTPKDAENQLRLIREIVFEFTRMKLVVKKAMEWVVFHLGNMFGGDLMKWKSKLKEFVDWFERNIKKWTEYIARGLMIIINMGRALVQVMQNVWGTLKYVWSILPDIAKGIALIGGAIALLRLNPVISALTILLLLLEDWYVWSVQKGKGSSKILAPLWEALSDGGKKLRTVFEPIKEVLKSLDVLKNINADPIKLATNAMTIFANVVAITVSRLTNLIATWVALLRVIRHPMHAKEALDELTWFKEMQSIESTISMLKIQQTLFPSKEGEERIKNWEDYKNKFMEKRPKTTEIKETLASKTPFIVKPFAYGMEFAKDLFGDYRLMSLGEMWESLPDWFSPKEAEAAVSPMNLKGDLMDKLQRAFGVDAQTAARIVMAESSGNPFAKNVNKNKSIDYGLFQINSMHIPDLIKAGIVSSANDLYDVDRNIAAAKFLYSRRGGFGDWYSSQHKWGRSTDLFFGANMVANTMQKGLPLGVPAMNIPQYFSGDFHIYGVKDVKEFKERLQAEGKKRVSQKTLAVKAS